MAVDAAGWAMSGCYVYVMSCGAVGAVKIGIAADVETRRRAVQTGNPSLVRVARRFGPWPREQCRAVEAFAHAALQDRQASGEWFFVGDGVAVYAIQSACDAIKDGMPLSDARDHGEIWRAIFFDEMQKGSSGE